MKQQLKHHIGSRIILVILLVALIVYAGTTLYDVSQMPEGEAERKIWAYAKENGLSYSDYPQQLIDLLRSNPETEKFVLEYPIAKDAVHTVDLSDMEVVDSVPLFMQWDQRWGYMRYGSDMAAFTACGPVCLSMAAYYLTQDPNFTPDRMIRFASDNGYYVPGSGSSWTLISEGGEALGFDITELPLDESRIRANLQLGIPIICVMGPGDFTTTGHFIVLTGYSDGMLQINDPNSIARSQQLWSYEQLKGQIRNLWAVRIPEA